MWLCIQNWALYNIPSFWFVFDFHPMQPPRRGQPSLPIPVPAKLIRDGDWTGSHHLKVRRTLGKIQMRFNHHEQCRRLAFQKVHRQRSAPSVVAESRPASPTQLDIYVTTAGQWVGRAKAFGTYIFTCIVFSRKFQIVKRMS